MAWAYHVSEWYKGMYLLNMLMLYKGWVDPHWFPDVRGEDNGTIADVYNKVVKNGVLPTGMSWKLSDDEVTNLEQCLHTPACTVYE